MREPSTRAKGGGRRLTIGVRDRLEPGVRRLGRLDDLVRLEARLVTLSRCVEPVRGREIRCVARQIVLRSLSRTRVEPRRDEREGAPQVPEMQERVVKREAA